MTSGRGEEDSPVAGGPARHVPVLLEDAVGALGPQAGGLYLDATFGAGGYTRAILAHEGARVIALDRDPTAIAAGASMVEEFGGRLVLRQARFGALAQAVRDAGFTALDGVVLDIGVSSMQFDEAARGFSFRFEGPLDMRMEMNGRSAGDIVNEADADELADIFFYYGEERTARRIARVDDEQIHPRHTALTKQARPAHATVIALGQQVVEPAIAGEVLRDDIAPLARAPACRRATPVEIIHVIEHHARDGRASLRKHDRRQAGAEGE